MIFIRAVLLEIMDIIAQRCAIMKAEKEQKMWTKTLTLENKDEFIKWAKNVFHDVGAQSLPVQHVINTLGYDEGYNYCLTWTGERQEVACQAWLRLWQDNGCPDIAERKYHTIDFLANDVYNKVPDKYYEQYFEWAASRHPDYFYRYALRSSAHLTFIKEKYPDAYKKHEILWPLDPSYHQQSDQELARQYWDSMTSDKYLPVKKVRNFIAQVKGKTAEICAACSVDDIKALIPHVPKKEVQSILKVVFHHRPDLRKVYFSDELASTGVVAWDTMLYPCDEAYDFMEKHRAKLVRYRPNIRVALPFFKKDPERMTSILNKCSLFGQPEDVLRLTELCIEKKIDFPAIHSGVEYHFERIALRYQWDDVISLRNHMYDENHSALTPNQYSNYPNMLKNIGAKRLKVINQIYSIDYFVTMSTTDFTELCRTVHLDSGMVLCFGDKPDGWGVIEKMKLINPKVTQEKEEIELLF